MSGQRGSTGTSASMILTMAACGGVSATSQPPSASDPPALTAPYQSTRSRVCPRSAVGRSTLVML